MKTSTAGSPPAKRAISAKAKAKAPAKPPAKPKTLPPWLIKAKKKTQKVRKQG